MGRCPIIWLLVGLLMAACNTQQVGDNNSPILVREITLGPPTQDSVSPIISPTLSGLTPEVVSPLSIVTVDADFVLVTPTLPPSKTPTQTPTPSPTPPPSPTPTTTVTATSRAPILPTSIIIPVTGVVVNPIAEVCDSTWFFIQPRPDHCPLNPAFSRSGRLPTIPEWLYGVGW